MGVLDGKVVLVTGGAGGIGRECALLAAREGAKVVVNDLGTSLSGADEAGAVSPAQATVDDIVAAGGQAIANTESVSSLAAVEGMVKQAIDAFGRIDGVINPAGILRDRMFHKMSEAEWDAVIAVHLRGAYNVSRAAVELFRNQGSGSFVHFTSTTGLIGNIGQANYAAAKLGVCGLSRSLALEGASKGVRSNVIAPFAWTRMTSSIPVTDEESHQRVERMRLGMRSDQVAQLSVALIADGAADVSGQIFCVRGDEVILFSQPRPVASIARSDGWTPERLLNGGLGALKPKFTDLGASASVFPYDPI
jgi:NAD(P)-dependent dehydrogenase (short-subunit alcohol dehydrogenase family)